MGINIAEYFRARESNDGNQARDLGTRKDSILGQIEKIKSEKRKIEKQRQDSQSLLDKVKQRGLPATRIEAEVADLGRKIEAAQSEISSLQQKYDAFDVPAQADFRRMNQLVEILARNKCVEAAELARAGDCFAYLPVGQVKHDKIGRPVECSIGLGSFRFKTLRIKPDDAHFRKNYWPPSLDWLPDYPSRVDAADTEWQAFQSKSDVCAYLNKSAGRLILTNTRFRDFGKREYGKIDDREMDFSDVAFSLEALVDDGIAKGGGELDLALPYEDNPLMAHVKSRIEALTTSESGFACAEDSLQSPEILEIIQQDWEAIAKAPWSDQIEGPMALLKYSLEKGEQARFWCTGIRSNFGFRLRTPDHDWLKGEIYIKTDGKRCNPGSPIEMQPATKGSDRQIAGLGRLFMSVARSSD